MARENRGENVFGEELGTGLAWCLLDAVAKMLSIFSEKLSLWAFFKNQFAHL